MQSPEYCKCLLINPQHNLFRERLKFWFWSFETWLEIALTINVFIEKRSNAEAPIIYHSNSRSTFKSRLEILQHNMSIYRLLSMLAFDFFSLAIDYYPLKLSPRAPQFWKFMLEVFYFQSPNWQAILKTFLPLLLLPTPNPVTPFIAFCCSYKMLCSFLLVKELNKKLGLSSPCL